MREAEIQAEVLEALGTRPDLCVVWRQSVGVAVPLHSPGQPRKFGVKGAADISGLLVDGRRLEVEVKSATGRQSNEQKSFERMIRRMGGIYLLVRSSAEAITGVMEALGHV